MALLRFTPSFSVVPAVLASCSVAAAVAPLGAATVEAKLSFDLPRGDAATTLRQFAAAAGRSLVFVTDKVRGETTNAVRGDFTPREALERMLAGSALAADEDAASGALVVSRKRIAEAAPSKGEVGPVSDPQPKPKIHPVTSKPRTLLAALAGWLATVSAADAATAPKPPGDEPIKLEAFAVTGSNIKRIEQEKTQPLTTLRAEQFEIINPGSPAEMLASLPMVTGLPLNETAIGTQSARGDNAQISLRGFASANTLILLNGRRIAGQPISATGELGGQTISVNVNQLPNRGLDRVDILRDGASSIYGSDAVAGVVNFVTNRRFRGTELSLLYGITEYGDGEEKRVSLLHGQDFANGKGRLVLSADRYNRAGIWLRDRPFSADSDATARAPAPWNVYTETTFNKRRTESAWGQFNAGVVTGQDQYGGYLVTPTRPSGIPATLFTATGRFFLHPPPPVARRALGRPLRPEPPVDRAGIIIGTTTPPGRCNRPPTGPIFTLAANLI